MGRFDRLAAAQVGADRKVDDGEQMLPRGIWATAAVDFGQIIEGGGRLPSIR